MYWELIWQLAKTDFKIRYNGSILGYIWALLKPLFIFLILNFVFSNIFGPNIPNYSLNLLTGIIFWNYFAEGTLTGITSLLSKANLITKVQIPKLAIIIASTVNATMTFVINLIILVVFFGYYRVTPSIAAIVLGVVFCVFMYLLILGFTLFMAPVFLKYRDLNQVWEVLLTLGFYASPIIYPLSLIPERYQPYLWLNPMSYLIHYAKLTLIEGRHISGSSMGLLALIVLTVLVLGGAVFAKLHKKVVEYL